MTESRTLSTSPLNFDLVVIGGGPAGTSGAATASLGTSSIALVERQRDIGGAGLNSGTVPSKTLRETALALSGWRSRKLFGVDLSMRREATVKDFMHHSDAVSLEERARATALLHRRQVHRFEGNGAFVDPHTVRVTRRDGTFFDLRGEKILIATGSSPFRPKEFDFTDERVHDSDELLHLKEMPKHLVVIGAGVIGSEYACTFRAMGVEIDLVDGRDMLLPFLDQDLSKGLEEAMRSDGIRFHWKETVTACDSSKPGPIVLTLASGATMSASGVLVCAGRSSNTETLNLAAAGIVPGNRGLVGVNATYQSTVPHIYAAGDVIGPPALASTSMEQARVAMCSAFGIKGKDPIAALLPTGIYTIPEVSTVGETEAQVKARGVDYVVGMSRFAETARGQIVGDVDGFLKLIFAREDLRLLGVHVLGEQATEIVHIGLIAMLAKGTGDLFNEACFNYPTLSECYKQATYDAILRIRGVRP